MKISLNQWLRAKKLVIISIGSEEPFTHLEFFFSRISKTSGSATIHPAIDTLVDNSKFGVSIIANEKPINWFDIAGVLLVDGKKQDIEPLIKQEISAALYAQSILQNSVDSIEDLKWIYYVSSKYFMYYFPYSDPEITTIVLNDHNKEYWVKASPENNPQRRRAVQET